MTLDKIKEALDEAGHGAHWALVQSLVQPAVCIVATALATAPSDEEEEEDEDEDDDEDDDDDDDEEGDEEDDDEDEDEDDEDDEEEGAVELAPFDEALAALSLGASRFGGVPDLPPGAAWPEREGIPMEFVAQLRLDDLPADARLPRSGSLLFFYNSQWKTSDMNEGEPCATVLFHPGPAATLVRATLPRVEFQSEFIDEPQLAPRIHDLASLAFTSTVSVPGGVSPYITPPLEDFWQDFTAEHGSELTDGGDYVNQLLGYTDAQDYVGAHVHGTEDQLLLQVDSDEAAGFQWGDCDRLYFMISKAELAARDFSKVRLYSIMG